MKRLLLALVCVIGCAGVAHAGCTEEEAQTKGEEFRTKLQQLAQQDRQKYQEVIKAVLKDKPDEQKHPDDMIEKMCEYYDRWNAKLK